MSDFATAWNLSRQRFVDEVKGLSDAQLRWRIHPDALSIGQMALHVAGVEISFGSQLLGSELSAEDQRLKAAATDGVVNSERFPFSDEEISGARVREALDRARRMVEPMLLEPSRQVLEKQIKSALGPVITGEGALARFTFHPAYHQGQAYLMKGCPGFPE